MAGTPFQPGDVIQLKSGGPLFTVSRVTPHGSIMYYYVDKNGLVAEQTTSVLAVAFKKVDQAAEFSNNEPNPEAGGA